MLAASTKGVLYFSPSITFKKCVSAEISPVADAKTIIIIIMIIS